LQQCPIPFVPQIPERQAADVRQAPVAICGWHAPALQ
jgi:hypothetical protein